MNHNFVYTNATTALPTLLANLMESEEVGSRAGRTKEMTHVGITLRKPHEREILVTGRRPSLVAQIAETMWVLAGRNEIEWLTHNYLPRAKDFSDDGKTWRAAYGTRIRWWNHHRPDYIGDMRVDQLAYVIDTLKASPSSRQAVINLWDPVVDTQPGKDIPCNDWLSFSSRLGRLDLHVAVRSNDAIWGWSGINAFEWSTLQEVVASILGLEVGSLHFSTTSFHIYDQHWNRADDIIRDQAPQPRLKPSPRTFVRSLEELDNLVARWFQIEEEIRTGQLSNRASSQVNAFPDPLFRSWLQVLQWWWSNGDPRYLEPLKGTRLEAATTYSVQPPQQAAANGAARATRSLLSWANGKGSQDSEFLAAAIALHNEKHAAYGDSWKRRGEMLGILANIARKVDRLGGAETKDETSADTAMDLMIYLAKYRSWLDNADDDTPDAANMWLRKIEQRVRNIGQTVVNPGTPWEPWLRESFDQLEVRVVEKVGRWTLVESMLEVAYNLARSRWEAEQASQYRGADVD